MTAAVGYSDDPMDHPLWAMQVELERGMLREGAELYKDRVVVARTKGQMSHLTPIRGMIDQWLPLIAEGLTDWKRQARRSRGASPIALPYLEQVDPFVAALIALRAVLDGITVERQAVTGLAAEIGRTIEHELQVRAWEKNEPALYRAKEKYLKRDKATSSHRARVNINRFNKLLEENVFGFGWEAWGPEVHFRVGVELINIIIRYTKWFDLVSDPNHVFKGKHTKARLILTAKPELSDWIGRQLDNAEVTNPILKPTVVPPKRWSGTRVGGYFTPYVKTPRLIRFKANQEQQREGAADEYEALDMPEVYSAIHTLQETPWKINGRVLDVAVEMWSRDYAVAKLPMLGENGQGRPLPEKPEDIDLNEDAARDWRRRASRVRGENAKNVSAIRRTTRTIQIAEEYREFDHIYFPHMLDFRGRAYPIPTGLQPQGDDLSRGLLTFGTTEPITRANGGVRWLAIQLASMWGNDKWSFDERTAWVYDNEALFRRIAADPVGCYREWSGVDKPWQALAALFEWVGYLQDGDGFRSSLPIMVDGTCNGIQHLAALTRDAVTGRYVNLIPGDRPEDIYREVANRLQRTLERIEEAGGEAGAMATWWLDLCERNLPRSLTKRQVMVLPYGGTKDSFFTYARKWLDEMHPIPEDATKEEWVERSRRVGFLVNHLWDTVGDVVSGGMRVMKWLQDCAKVALVANQPIFWRTPSGFVVRHFYGTRKERRIEVKLDGQTTTLSLPEYTKDLDSKSQLQGIPPNFIHSLDASALVSTINAASAAGISSFSSIHDAYGTHAGRMDQLFGILRQAFIDTHNVDVLGEFREGCMSVLRAVYMADGLDFLEASEKADAKLPPPLDKGDLDLEAVLQSDYFFA